MANAAKMPIFKSQGSEDLDQFWFVTKDVWKAWQINDDDMKKEQLLTMLQDKALSWYIKYSTTNLATSLAVTKNTLNA